MIKNLLNATKDNPDSPDGTFDIISLLDKGISSSANSALMSRLKAFLSCLPFKLSAYFAAIRLIIFRLAKYGYSLT